MEDGIKFLNFPNVSKSPLLQLQKIDDTFSSNFWTSYKNDRNDKALKKELKAETTQQNFRSASGMDKTNYAFKTLYQRKVLSDFSSKEDLKITTSQIPIERPIKI